MFHFNKVAGLATQLFSCEKFLRTPILKNIIANDCFYGPKIIFSPPPPPPPPHPPQKKERKRKTQKRPLEKSLE